MHGQEQNITCMVRNKILHAWSGTKANAKF